MVKNLVYQTAIVSRKDLEQRTTVACRFVTPEMLIKVRKCFCNRINDLFKFIIWKLFSIT